MAEQSVFDKIHVEEKDKADLSGVLEQLNLPPAVVEFVRRNQKAIYIVLSVIAVVVVSWSLYGSYVEKKITDSSSALASAVKAADDIKISSLQGVAEEFSGTDAATWANIEIAQTYISEEKYGDALTIYSGLRQELKAKEPLFPLILFGIAQTEETLGNFDNAIQEYISLQSIKGYESIGYIGAARIYEVQERYGEAVQELEKYQGVLIGDNPNSPEKAFIETKIVSLKGQM